VSAQPRMAVSADSRQDAECRRCHGFRGSIANRLTVPKVPQFSCENRSMNGLRPLSEPRSGLRRTDALVTRSLREIQLEGICSTASLCS
jgi:hypothetical protein